ncbi:MAG: hypothetical protein HY868_21710 [Chloroflexi bacterium]|nr:hypothetical protein [Chloroflexota bacterium]
MQKSKFANYGKLSDGGEAYNFALERYNDLLREAEENRLSAPTPRSAPSNKNQSPLKAFRQLIAQLL